jgi:shikimate kinase
VNAKQGGGETGAEPGRSQPGGRVRRILLVGFMAAGKSTVGRILADQLGWRFVDVDAEIERRAGRSIAEIFRTDGEAAFRVLEAELVASLDSADRSVIAPGGGWAARPGALEVRSGTVTVWLRVSPEEAVRRARAARLARPLLETDDPLATARELLGLREPFYRQARIWIDAEQRGPHAIANEIRERIENE